MSADYAEQRKRADRAMANEMGVLCRERLEPTDKDVLSRRHCPDCGYEIEPRWEHGRHPQPEGASHSMCRLQKAALGPRMWTNSPPWPPQGVTTPCTRCGEFVPRYHRHYWPPCRDCCVWSYVGQQVLAALGLNAHEWLYWGARPYCRKCNGIGYLPCQVQDLSVMRQSGNCTVCGTWAFKLIHCTDEQKGDVEGSARHYGDGPWDHDADVQFPSKEASRAD